MQEGAAPEAEGKPTDSIEMARSTDPVPASVCADDGPVRPLAGIAAAVWKRTPRQTLVLLGVVRGLTDPEIASELGLSTRTLDRHVRGILARSGSMTRDEVTGRVLQLNGRDAYIY
jgi:DNA-binding NarL/FixJ family response regulator